MKWVGALLVIFACSVCGYVLWLEKKERESLLSDLVVMLELFCEQVSCALTPLPEALASSARKKAGYIFSESARLIQEGAFPEDAFCVSLQKVRALTDADKQVLLAFAKGLGAESKEGQLSNAGLCKERVRSLLEEAKAEASKSAKLYKSGGVLVGMLITLIML